MMPLTAPAARTAPTQNTGILLERGGYLNTFNTINTINTRLLLPSKSVVGETILPYDKMILS